MNVPLQPLRVPTGWTMDYNNGLWEIDPNPTLIPEGERWVFFKEDMLQIRHERRNRLLDLGWYLEGDLVNGQYKLVLYEDDCRGRVIHEFRTCDRLALVAEIERLLLAVAQGQL